MNKHYGAICGCCIVLLLAAEGLCNSRTEDPIGVAISPQTLILGTDQGGRVTVNTAIPYSTVDVATLALQGVPAVGAMADNRGELVALFDELAVEAIVQPPKTTLTLTGSTKDGTPFSGSDTVRVITTTCGQGEVASSIAAFSALMGLAAIRRRR